jgi:trk system potassium uptake protein TrkA
VASYAVIGLGRFGRMVAEVLAADGAEVIAVDLNPTIIENIKDKVTIAVRMDSTDETALISQGIDSVDAVIVGIGDDFEANQLTTVLAKKIGVKKVITRARTPVQAKILSLIGADEVIMPEEETAQRLAQRLTRPNIRAYLELAEGYSLVEVTAPRKFHGSSLQEINLRKKFGVTLVVVKKRVQADNENGYEERINDVPGADYIIQPDDILVLVGPDDKLSVLAEE